MAEHTITIQKEQLNFIAKQKAVVVQIATVEFTTSTNDVET